MRVVTLSFVLMVSSGCLSSRQMEELMVSKVRFEQTQDQLIAKAKEGQLSKLEFERAQEKAEAVYRADIEAAKREAKEAAIEDAKEIVAAAAGTMLSKVDGGLLAAVITALGGIGYARRNATRKQELKELKGAA